ncbi:uncharacterized protein SPEM3 [Sorex araneus]|uniref:uncharacterized protein SPEM3 n=1 Tax=Sorex araneus TaxID=42254 RepID=UPI0024334588|nr:uncharacterized protein SPEM3 [Sorex araneus]
MGEQAYHGAQVCSSTNPRKCQDLGDSILLLLGSFILLNVGINVVTLLWRHLKSSLRIIFRYFFPKDKQHSCPGGHPLCMRCSPSPKNLCSRVPSRFYRHPSYPLGHPTHLDSWMPDVNDEKAFKCCWKPSQCGHGGAPMELPWGLSKEGMAGAGEAPQAQNLKTHTNLLSKQDTSSQPTRMSKLDTAPLHLPQEIKTKTPDSGPAQANAPSSPPTAEQVPKTSPPTQTPQDSSSQAQIGPPVSISDHSTPQAQVHSSTLEHLPTQAQGHELPSVQRLAEAPAPAPSDTSVPALDHTPENMTSSDPAPVVGAAHATHAHTHVQVPAPNFAPVTPLTFVPVATVAPAPTPAPVPVPTTTPATSVSASIPVPTPGPISAPNPATFNHGLSTGHVVYDARRIKQNLFQVYPPQHSGFPRKDLGALIMSQEGQRLLNSDTPGQASKSSDGESAKTSVGSILGYLELGNMEWKLSNDVEDRFSQSKSFPYCSFHPCSSEGKNTDPQASVCPKFLVYSKDAAPSQPCFHSPTSTCNSQCIPPPCTLSLPLASPRSFVFDHPSNHLMPTLNTSVILTASKSPTSNSAPQCPNPPQLSTISQDQPPKLHESLYFTQDSGHHKTPDPSKESIVPRKSCLSQNVGFHRNASLCKGLVISQDSELHKNPIINEALGPPKNSDLTKEADMFRNPSLTQPSDLHENIPFPKQSNIQNGPDFTQDSRVYINLEQNQKTIIYKNQDVSQNSGLHDHPGPSQDSRSFGSTGSIQMPVVSRNADSDPQKYVSQDSGAIKSSDLSQESGNHKNPDFDQTSHLHKESGDYKSLCLTQDSDPHKNLSLTTEVKQRFGFAHVVGICRNPENSQDSNFHKYPGVHQNCDPSKKQVFTQDSDQLKHLGVSQESTPNHDHNPNDLAQGINGSVQVSGPPQAPKSTESSMKSFVSKEGFQKENAEPHVSWMSIPPNQNSCSSKSHMVHNDLHTYSEVPVLVELQPTTKQTASQDWVYHPVNIAPSVCQNYRQMSVPPKPNWKPYYPGPGTRLGHVVFDARQRQFGVGRDKCEALFPRRFRQDIPSNSAEWEYQCVMRNLDKEGTKMHQE